MDVGFCLRQVMGEEKWVMAGSKASVTQGAVLATWEQEARRRLG